MSFTKNQLITSFILTLCFSLYGTSQSLPVSKYYEYDQSIPLQDTLNIVETTEDFKLYELSYRSVHNKRVKGLLSIPNNSKKPAPVVILLHGKGDRKTVDYIEYGNSFFTKNGYAVLRIDISNHGDRIENEFEFNLNGENKYWTRNIVSQTVFDLRRAIDFIFTQKELDSDRIGYLGISLGGITGTVFCGVEDRVKVPIIVIAGGQLNMLFGESAQDKDVNDFLSIIEPLNFVEQIAPRPFLMINAEKDAIVHPEMGKALYSKAKSPKNIIWYPTTHHTIPIDKVYQDGVNWFEKYLN